MEKTIQIQTQIRNNAEEISSALSEMQKWEKQMRNRDGNIKSAHAKAARVPRAPIRSGVGTVPVQGKDVGQRPAAAADNSNSLWQTPSSIVAPKVRYDSKASEPAAAVPQARGSYQARDLEETERERGNAEFKAGNFTMAVKCYTKCLGLKAGNFVAFSNRAMAYLKLKEYVRAVTDCSCALQIEPTHVKSLLRRSTAYNALGKHRAALRDLLAAAAIEPANKQVRSDLVSTKEQLRNAVSRAPTVALAELADSTGDANVPETDDAPGQVAGGLRAPLQGPDPAPPSFHVDSSASPSILPIDHSSGSGSAAVTLQSVTAAHRDSAAPTTASTSTSTSTTRVAITIADEDDSDGDEEQQSAGNASTLPVPPAAPPSAAVSNTTSAASPAKSSKVTPKKDISSAKNSTIPTSAEVLPIRSSYDLERELKLAASDVSKLAALFKRLKVSQVGKVLADLMEPSVLHLLLRAVFRYHVEHKNNLRKAVDWFVAVKGVKRFAHQYVLLDEELRVAVRGMVEALRQRVVDSAEAGEEGPSVEAVDDLLSVH